MTTSITATIAAAQPLSNVQIDVVIDNPGTVTGWTVVRLTIRDNTPIRIAATTSGAASFIDYEAPIQQPVSYRLDVVRGNTSESVTSNQVTITGTRGCYLSDPYSTAVMSIEVQAWPQRDYAARQSVLEILSRPDPVVLSDVHTTGAGTWTLLTRTDAATARMLTILRASGMVQLRTQPASSIASVYAAVGDIGETRYTGRGDDPTRLTAVSIQEIAPVPAAAQDLQSTLLGLSGLAGTLAELATVRPTLLQLSQIRTG